MNLSADAQRLRITELVETHNHETSEDRFNRLPKQRLSLDESQKASVQEMLALKCNKKLIKQHIVTTMKKNVTLRDIHNMKVKDSNSLEETVAFLKSLGGHVEVVLDENKLEGIFYQDSRMKEAFAASPDLLLLLDATS
uniref:Uncharacterized protein n=1 Tax=Cacopsylla melanoneura TaxID=428564 RepID=A0A8D8WBK8_9HEMI